MEFRFRAVDRRPPAYFSPSPSSSNGTFFQQPPRVATNQFMERRPNAELMRNGMVERQIEKDLIRAEIMGRRRRALEYEVMRELMMERETTMHIANRIGGRPVEERPIMQLQVQPRVAPFPLLNEFDNRRGEERFLLPARSVFDPPLLSRQVSETSLLPVPDYKRAPEDNFIMLNKGEPKKLREKRKGSPGGGGLKKKGKKELSCALCQMKKEARPARKAGVLPRTPRVKSPSENHQVQEHNHAGRVKGYAGRANAGEYFLSKFFLP
ncbi:uncharacterized protein [Euphorbia lathyris]|uniref:uncharacterized protein n=1 Tax=Euphorbia lathyris TaxID=212925 RepID=UPI003313BE7C